ncbi:AMP-binding protein [Pseudomonas sp. WS 5021]|uniref:SDR family oxidoreductase n=1 Tax=Pseudomonas sp. WS 5021 TaxID=2717490 RepID=UPI001473FBB0|nr:SDR family oxidoreductase [Pseudomonas sp. WS 5021]NMY27988.1 AMP-binding protein [Pseudomonas sp. WS 5021]
MLTSSHLPNVIVWAVSRSRSTAFERAVMQHPGVKVLHEQLSEPFLARHFPAKHALIERNRQAAQGPAGITHYSQALALLSQRPAEPQHLQCAKEIAYFFDFQAIDGAWLTAFKHVFLVRQPLAVMQSLYRVSQGGGTTYFDADESGFDELARIHGLVLEHCPSDHVLYLDSDADLMADPQGTLLRFCDFAGIEYSPRLLAWQPEQVAQWQFFKGWHDDAERSCGFAQVTHPAMDFPPIVEQTARDKQVIYRFFQLCATWQRQADTADHLKCLHEPATTRLQVLLLAHTDEQRQRALQLAAHLPDDYALWLLDSASHTLSDQTLRELALLQDGPLVLLTANEHLTYCSPEQARQRFLCLVAPDTASARALGLPLITLEPNTPAAQGPRISAQLATLARNASLHSRARQIASNRYASAAIAPGLSWQQHFLRLLEQAPESLVAMTPHRQLNARQLHAHAVTLAERLSSQCAHGGWVAIRLDKDLRSLISMTACSLLGWPYLDIPHWYGLEATAKALANLRPVVVIGDSSSLNDLPPGYPSLVFDELPATPARPATLLHRVPGANDLAYGLLTSGTTGTAKIVTIGEHGRLDSLALWQQHIRPGDRVGLNAWMAGYVYYPIFSGATVCLMPDAMVLDPQALRAFVEHGQLSQLMITPSLAAGLMHDEPAFKQAFAGVRCLWLSGEQLPPSTRQNLVRCLPNCRVIDLYGSNEAGDVALVAPDGHLQWTPGTQAYVLDPALDCTPLGGHGELYVQTPGLSVGYLEDDAANRSAFVANPLAQECPALAPRLLRTGDRVRLDEAGEVYLIGRATTHLKVRGFKIFSADVERVLMAHPEVRSALVTTRGEGPDLQLVAFICAVDSGKPPTAGALRQWAGQHLPAFSVPLGYFLAASIPAGASQKRLGAQALLQQPLTPLADEQPPLTPLQTRLARLWARCMNLQGVTLGPDSDFIEIGGSLLLLDLINRINRAFDTDLTIADITRDSTLAGISRQLAHRLQGAPLLEVAFSVAAHAKRYLAHLNTAVANLPQVPPRLARRTLLVTGATGYLGRRVVAELQHSAGVQTVLCLVRADDPAQAQRRIAELGLTPGSARVVGLAGDLAQPRLGMSSAAYQSLCQEVDCIIHCAADVNWLKSYERLAQTNVGGVVEVLGLAAASGAAVVFASTLPEPVPSTGYNRAKLVAEQLALGFCQSRGLCLNILRCGDISAPANPGSGSSINQEDYVGLLIRSCLALKAWPDEAHWSLNLTPVDYVAQVFTHTALHGQALGLPPLQHLYNPAPNLPWTQLCAWMQTLLGHAQFAPLPLAQWQARLKAQAPGQAVLQRTLLILAMIIDDFSHFHPPPPLLLDHLKCPAIDAEWTQHYLAALTLTQE